MCIVSSCCCFNLRTGSLILGWLGLIGSILEVIGSILQPVGVDHFGLLAAVVYLLTYGILLYGIYMQKPTWILLGVVLSMVDIVYFVISGIVAFSMIASNEKINEDDRKVTMIIAIVIYCAILALGIYFTSVLYSYYKQVKENGKNPSVA